METEKISIYFDTNFLEVRNSKKLYLSELRISPVYYSIINLIDSLDIWDKVELCIPEVVICEMKHHMLAQFKSEKTSFEDRIKDYKSIFGDLLDINYEIKEKNDYEDYLNTLFEEFINNPKNNVKVVKYPRDELTIETLLDNALKTHKPFSRARGNSKEYSDAGFKDALIYETIVSYTNQNIGILFSNDNDFDSLFNGSLSKPNLKLFKEMLELEEYLATAFGFVSKDFFTAKIRNNDYLMRQILSYNNIDEDAPYRFIKTIDFTNTDQEVDTTIELLIDNQNIRFHIVYNTNANELIESDIVTE